MSSDKKRSILITGCSQGGAGNALALEFAARGFRVFATARSLKSMTNLSEQGIETLVLDVTVPQSILALKEVIAQRTGGTLDILYNNAGSMYEAPALDANPDQIRKMFDANVFGLFDMVTAFTPLLISAASQNRNHKPAFPSPTIVNVASVLARIPLPFASAYNASKAAVASYSDTLRLELSPLGIRVVTLFMGLVSTRLQSADNVNFKAGSLYIDTEAKMRDRIAKNLQVGMAPDVFAQQVVAKILGDAKTNYVWKGTSAFIVWLLNALGPRKVFDSMLKGQLGLDDSNVIKLIYERGRRSVSDRR